MNVDPNKDPDAQNLSQPFPKTSASFEQQKKQGNQQTRRGASCIKRRKAICIIGGESEALGFHQETTEE